jgi:hypothetical protein
LEGLVVLLLLCDREDDIPRSAARLQKARRKSKVRRRRSMKNVTIFLWARQYLSVRHARENKSLAQSHPSFHLDLEYFGPVDHRATSTKWAPGRPERERERERERE